MQIDREAAHAAAEKAENLQKQIEADLAYEDRRRSYDFQCREWHIDAKLYYRNT